MVRAYLFNEPAAWSAGEKRPERGCTAGPFFTSCSPAAVVTPTVAVMAVIGAAITVARTMPAIGRHPAAAPAIADAHDMRILRHGARHRRRSWPRAWRRRSPKRAPRSRQAKTAEIHEFDRPVHMNRPSFHAARAQRQGRDRACISAKARWKEPVVVCLSFKPS